jgi:hypothetical protein
VVGLSANTATHGIQPSGLPEEIKTVANIEARSSTRGRWRERFSPFWTHCKPWAAPAGRQPER